MFVRSFTTHFLLLLAFGRALSALRSFYPIHLHGHLNAYLSSTSRVLCLLFAYTYTHYTDTIYYMDAICARRRTYRIRRQWASAKNSAAIVDWKWIVEGFFLFLGFCCYSMANDVASLIHLNHHIQRRTRKFNVYLNGQQWRRFFIPFLVFGFSSLGFECKPIIFSLLIQYSIFHRIRTKKRGNKQA